MEEANSLFEELEECFSLNQFYFIPLRRYCQVGSIFCTSLMDVYRDKTVQGNTCTVLLHYVGEAKLNIRKKKKPLFFFRSSMP